MVSTLSAAPPSAAPHLSRRRERPAFSRNEKLLLRRLDSIGEYHSEARTAEAF